MANPGECILMPRNVHISVIKVCAMQNIIPIFFDVQYSVETGHYKQLTKSGLKRYLEKYLLKKKYCRGDTCKSLLSGLRHGHRSFN